MTRSGERFTLALERRLSHAPEKVWRVVTEKDLLHQWFPAHVIGDWTVGSQLRFEFQHGEGEGLSEEEMRGEVLAVEPPRLLEFRWGTHILRCELTPDGDGCRLHFSANFTDASWGARDAAGWDYCLENLERVLQDKKPVAFDPDAWRGRHEHYVARFEPEFGHQDGPPGSDPRI